MQNITGNNDNDIPPFLGIVGNNENHSQNDFPPGMTEQWPNVSRLLPSLKLSPGSTLETRS